MLTPALAVLLSFVVLGEVPTWIEFVGLAMVTAGMIVALGLHQSAFPSRWKRKGEAASGYPTRSTMLMQAKQNESILWPMGEPP
jgi:uncharacterized membrane protein YecN with MAPEG domain